MNNHICNCRACVDARNKKNIKATIKVISLQQEFEASCFMYEHIESELKVAVDKFNGSKPLTPTQRQILAKAIWRS